MSMRFPIDAGLPRSVGDTVRYHEYEAIDVRDIGMDSARDPEIARYAQMEGLALISGGYGFADIRNYPPEQYAGIVVLYVPRNATAAYLNQSVNSFFAQ